MKPTGRQPGAQQLQICVICETPTSEKLTKVSDVGLEVYGQLIAGQFSADS